MIREALPPDLYAELSARYPDIATVAGAGTLKNNTLYLKSALEVIDNPVFADSWRAFFAYHCSREFYLEAIRLWRAVLDRSHPGVAASHGKALEDFTCGIRRPGSEDNPANKNEDIQLDCQFGVNSPVSQVTSVRGPHTDSCYKLFAALLYVRAEGDDSSGGELELYRYRDPALRYRSDQPVDPDFVKKGPMRALTRIDPKLVEKVETIAYEPNTLVMWLNTPHSVHGVSPRGLTDWPRRYVNFLGESYVGPPEGFFMTKKKLSLWPA